MTGPSALRYGAPPLGHTVFVKLPRILLVEDDEHTRAHLARVLDADARLELVASEGTLAAGRAALERLCPDVLITDIELPDGSGIELIRAIETLELPTLPMAITIFGDQKTVVAALEAGALGYLLKDGSADYIVRSTLELLDGGSPVSPAIARHLLRRLRDPASSLKEAGRKSEGVPADLPQLSARELEVLGHLVKGFTYSETAKLLGVTTHTVATHVRRLYRKLAVRSRGEAVYEALQLGLVKDA
jgi:DNA-binding NarL/FixJ family response regulator